MGRRLRVERAAPLPDHQHGVHHDDGHLGPQHQGQRRLTPPAGQVQQRRAVAVVMACVTASAPFDR